MKLQRSVRTAPLACGLLLTSLLAGGPGWAAPPSNDNRADAIRINPPGQVTGTLVDATLETNEQQGCADVSGSVWYRFTAPKRGAVIIALDAAGDMDGDLTLYRQVRSKLQYETCEFTDSRGRATIDTDTLEPSADYAIRVGVEQGSVADTFDLSVLVPSPPPEPPGKRLPAKGARNKVDRLLNTGDAYWTRMREGRTMRLSLRTNSCTALEVYGPGTKDFDGYPLKSMNCGGYSLFTPTETGRHFLVVQAGRSREPQPYRLRVGTAGRDDTIPGIFIANNSRVRGQVNGGIDSRDLYRFDVTRRSKLTLTVTGGPDVRLVTDSGRRLGRGDVFDRTLAPGRYFVAVEGSGKYTLKRVLRTITDSSVTFNGRRQAVTGPGRSASIVLRVRPAVSGPGTMVVERFDPFDGWQFSKRYRVNVRNGSAVVSYQPASIGRYRVYAQFKGSTTAAPSDAGWARLKVQEPLSE